MKKIDSEKVFMSTLCFELTRRCNMNCDFCCRGDAQNKDITKQIINKTLAEVKGFGIENLRITGGEPFLNEDMLCYLIDKVIKENISINKVVIFTNGTIISPKIKKALLKIGKYCKKNLNTTLGKEVHEYITKRFTPAYDTHSLVEIIVSTTGHRKIDIDKVISFYNENVDTEILCAYNQDISFNDSNQYNQSAIALEGNGFKNFQKFYDEGHRHFSFVHNKYCLIDDFPYNLESGDATEKRISKAITVSVNGNVFAGCSQAYEKVDNGYAIFNIMDCRNNFYKLIDDFSWKYPLLDEQNKRIGNYMVGRWNYEHNIAIQDYLNNPDSLKGETDEHMYELFGQILNLFEDLEEIIQKVHKEYYLFNHWEANEFALYLYCYTHYEKFDGDVTGNFILQLLSSATDPENYNKYTKDDVETELQKMLDIYKNKLLESSPLLRFVHGIGLV